MIENTNGLSILKMNWQVKISKAETHNCTERPQVVNRGYPLDVERVVRL